mmetsp:Transcript_29402/g.87192  ORF Transcript_29402/g.87192 Transcript_29402/m.87192 type:complete len:281 (-) Transcript_29402:401-1243(-)
MPSLTSNHPETQPPQSTNPFTERVLLPQISILPSCQISSVTGRSLLLVPRTNKASRLPPDPFCITFCRKIRLPLMRHPLQCKYGKMANIYGDHYFDYHHYSKMRVHNQTCDTHCTAFKTIAPYCLIIEDHANVLLETIELSQQHPPKLPADVALSIENKPFYYTGVDFTVAGSPKAAASTKEQQRKNLSNLRSKEIMKWRRTANTKTNETNQDGTANPNITGKISSRTSSATASFSFQLPSTPSCDQATPPVVTPPPNASLTPVSAPISANQTALTPAIS